MRSVTPTICTPPSVSQRQLCPRFHSDNADTAPRAQERERREREGELMRDFRTATAAAAAARRAQGDLVRGVKLVESYDEREGLPRSHLWPEEGAGGSGGSAATASQRAAALSAARARRAAAGERGVAEEAEEAAGTSGRGGGDDDDGNEKEEPLGGAPQSPVAAAREQWLQLPVEERLAQVIEYLRERHRHCLYCGCQVRGTAAHDDMWFSPQQNARPCLSFLNKQGCRRACSSWQEET